MNMIDELQQNKENLDSKLN